MADKGKAALTGAASGAAAGAVLGPWGAAAGGVIGGALGYFGDGDLMALSEADRLVLRAARDRVGPLPVIPPKAPMLDH